MTIAEANAADPLAAIEGAGFDRVFADKIEPVLTRLEAARRKASQRLVMLGGGAVALVALLSAIGVDPRVLIVLAIVGGVFAYAPLSNLRALGKQAVVPALCNAVGATYVAHGFEPPAFASFVQLKLLPWSTSKRFEDHFSGRLGDAAFALCDAELSVQAGKSTRLVFRGQIFQLITPKRRLATTVILRQEGGGWFDHADRPAGVQKVGLEDPAFEKLFEVYGSDQVEAREIITPTFMEHMLALERQYAGGQLRCAFVGSDVLIAIQGPNRFEVGGGLTSSFAGRGAARAVVRDLEATYRLMAAVQAL